MLRMLVEEMFINPAESIVVCIESSKPYNNALLNKLRKSWKFCFFFRDFSIEKASDWFIVKLSLVSLLASSLAST